MLSVGIYGKKVLFFVGLFVILVGIGYFVSRQFTSASIEEASYEQTQNQYIIDVEIKKNADVFINNKKMPRLLHMGQETNEFRYMAVSEEGIYIDNLTIYVHLPEPVNENDIKQKVYAIHGIESYDFYQKDSQTLVYKAKSLFSASTFTIVAQLPKGLINFPLTSKLIFALSNLPSVVWIIVSLTLPLLTLILLFWLFQQKIIDWRMTKSKDEIAQPPSDISPGELEILTRGKISSRAIAATLLNMAQKDYIHIVQREDGFSFGKKKLYDQARHTFSPNMTKPEKFLASKIFTEENIKSQREDIIMRVSRHVFSRKIANVFIAFYDLVTEKKYFKENPSGFHRKYYIVGLILFFLGLLAFIFGIWLAPEPKFLLVFWFMMMMSALMIVRMASQIPLRTNKGKNELIQWLKFKNFLTSEKPIEYKDGIQNIFEKYLPYAVIMGCEVEWAKRFTNQTFRLPDWYTSERSIVVMEDFMASIFPIIGFISRSLVASKEPIVH